MKPIPSGPILDRMIAEQVMGLSEEELENLNYAKTTKTGLSSFVWKALDDLPPFSTELTVAWAALEKLNPPFCKIERDTGKEGVSYFVSFQKDYASSGLSIESLAHAICLALLDELRLRDQQEQWEMVKR